ncbi:hypothetical protein [Aeromicrobium sp. CF3.5]|uniref:hypothetical protein n=1 Tax=Aeromicrobium sp. CF3.5 TaxID=3373078 RepID=UPI003EE6D488
MYVAHRFPLGGLWWPTTGEDIRVEDLGTLPGKALLLEAKVPELQADGSHVVTIDIAQLLKYVSSVAPVYYTFPVPPWTGDLASSSWLGIERRADLAYKRAAHRWFGAWTVVCTASALLSHVAPAVGQKHATLKTVPASHWRWQAFWKQFRDCGSATLPSVFLLDGPVPDAIRARLRERLEQLRQARDEERQGQRRAFTESLRDRPRFLYVPDRNSTTPDRYVLAGDGDLSASLANVVSSQQPGSADSQAEPNHISVCHVPFTVLG